MSTDYIPFTVTDLDLTEEMQNELLENFKNGKELDQKKLEDLRTEKLASSISSSNISIFLNSLNDELRLSKFEEQ